MQQKILLVEDDTDDQFFFTDVLREIDHCLECIITENGREALDYLINFPPPPDMIFLDLNMPLMNGFECLSELKKKDEFKNIPVTIFTTSRSDTDRKRALGMGAKNFLTKTVDYIDFKTNIRAILLQSL